MSLKSLPKVELHCHLEGILDPDMARLIQAEDSTFPLDVDAFAQIYPIQGYDAFNDWFKFCSPIFGQRRFFLPVMARHIAHLKAQNVRYTEIMLGRITLGRKSIVESYQAFRDWLNQHETEDFQIELLVMLGRNQPPESLAASAPTILALYEAGLIVGVALAGPEKGHPIKPFRRTLARFHEAGLGIEIHAGEWAGPESVWDALNYGYSDRIGHGIHLFQDSQLIDLFLERQIHIEFCPTSNVRTGSISRIEEHPLAEPENWVLISALIRTTPVCLRVV